MGSRDQMMNGREMHSAGGQPGVRSLVAARAAAVVITVGIAAASFVLSFAALHDLAARAGIPAQLAWLWPLIVDGTILQATTAVVALAGDRQRDRSRRYFWIVLSSAAAVSLGANALHAIVSASAPLGPWLAAAIAVVAPIALLATTHGLSLLIRVSDPLEYLCGAKKRHVSKCHTTTIRRCLRRPSRSSNWPSTPSRGVRRSPSPLGNRGSRWPR